MKKKFAKIEIKYDNLVVADNYFTMNICEFLCLFVVVCFLVIVILSISKGFITDKEAFEQNVGGELLCYVY